MEAGNGWHDDFERRVRKTLDGLPLKVNCDLPLVKYLIVQYNPDPSDHSRLDVFPEVGEVTYSGLQKLSRLRHGSSFCPSGSIDHQPGVGIYDKRTGFFVSLYTVPLVRPEAKK
jgi:hypothetical protein